MLRDVILAGHEPRREALVLGIPVARDVAEERQHRQRLGVDGWHAPEGAMLARLPGPGGALLHFSTPPRCWPVLRRRDSRAHPEMCRAPCRTAPARLPWCS